MSKISINYYLNTDLKPVFNKENEECYPVYIRVIFKKQLTRIRSGIKQKLTKNEFEKWDNFLNFKKEETRKIILIIRYLDSVINDLNIKKSKTTISQFLAIFNKGLDQVLRETNYLTIEEKQIINKNIANFISLKTGLLTETVEDIMTVDILSFDKIRIKTTILELSINGMIDIKTAAKIEFLNVANNHFFNNGLSEFDINVFDWIENKERIIELFIKNSLIIWDKVNNKKQVNNLLIQLITSEIDKEILMLTKAYYNDGFYLNIDNM